MKPKRYYRMSYEYISRIHGSYLLTVLNLLLRLRRKSGGRSKFQKRELAPFVYAKSVFGKHIACSSIVICI